MGGAGAQAIGSYIETFSAHDGSEVWPHAPPNTVPPNTAVGGPQPVACRQARHSLHGICGSSLHASTAFEPGGHKPPLEFHITGTSCPVVLRSRHAQLQANGGEGGGDPTRCVANACGSFANKIDHMTLVANCRTALLPASSDMYGTRLDADFNGGECKSAFHPPSVYNRG